MGQQLGFDQIAGDADKKHIQLSLAWSGTGLSCCYLILVSKSGLMLSPLWQCESLEEHLFNTFVPVWGQGLG